MSDSNDTIVSLPGTNDDWNNGNYLAGMIWEGSVFQSTSRDEHAWGPQDPLDRVGRKIHTSSHYISLLTALQHQDLLTTKTDQNHGGSQTATSGRAKRVFSIVDRPSTDNNRTTPSGKLILRGNYRWEKCVLSSPTTSKTTSQTHFLSVPNQP
jgi:hypothetical protein